MQLLKRIILVIDVVVSIFTTYKASVNKSQCNIGFCKCIELVGNFFKILLSKLGTYFSRLKNKNRVSCFPSQYPPGNVDKL